MEGTRIVTLEPEERVLLHTARLQLEAGSGSELEGLLRRKVDWDRLVGKADWHETAALLLHHLEVSGLAESVPERALSKLKTIKLEQRVRFFFFLQPELLRVLEGMALAGVEIVPLKGAFLMNTVYPEFSLRPVGDLDLLARVEDLPRAMETLAELGYRAKSGGELLPGGANGDHHHCPRVLSPDGAVELELHRHIVRKRTPLYFPVERFWERSARGEIAGRPATVLAGRDLVTHLCLAFFLDRRRRTRGYGSLRQLVDLSESVRYFEREIDWEAMAEEYTGRALQRPLYVALRTSQELLGAPIPVEFLQSFEPHDFDQGRFGDFLRFKVLNEGFWFLHELVDPNDNHWWNMTKAAIHRLLPPASYLEDKYRLTANADGDRLLWKHLRDASRMAVETCRRPRSTIQELRADFWINQLQL